MIKLDGAQLSKTAYHRIGRTTHSFVLAEDDDTAYGGVDDGCGDIVLAERQTVYDGDEVELTVATDRFHDDYGSGETTGALDTNADGDRRKVTAADLEGRAQITTFFHDTLARRTATGVYGTNGGSTFDRSTLSSAPSSTDDHPVRSTTYADDGTVLETSDPLGRVTRREYDDLGRLTAEIANYDASVNSGAPSGTEDNQTVRYAYTDGLQTTITAHVPSGGTDQVTTYTYDTTKGSGAGDSKVSTGHLLSEVEYPDSVSASDVVTYAYDARGRRIYVKDQAGNVIDESYDAAGSLTSRAVSTLASGFDGAVRRIDTAYDDLGRGETVTQYDAASAGSVVDEVAFSYDGWGNVESFEQNRDLTVGASGSVDDYEVSYSYEKATAGRNTVRRTGVPLPSGNELSYDYSSAANPHDDAASRVSGVADGAVSLVQSRYNGTGHLVYEAERWRALLIIEVKDGCEC